MAAPPSLEQRLLALLQGSEAAAAGGPRSAPVSACCSPLSRISPGLSVEGVGAVALPLSEAAAGELKAHAQPSPFGRGEQTLLDPSVRRSLQIEPSQLRLANPRWEGEVVPEAVRRAKAGLGISEDTAVRAELYKLLLYEPGSFFKKHRDTEKAAGMFGTLCIMLPSAYKGGQLLVSLGNDSQTIDLAARSAKTSCFAAFYADCQHEVLPVTSGHRLCLVYNLVFAGQGPPPPQLPQGLAHRLAELVREWEAGLAAGDTGGEAGSGAAAAAAAAAGEAAGTSADGAAAAAAAAAGTSSAAATPKAPQKLCFMLAHRYSQESLQQRGVQALKPPDRAAAQLLLDACQVGSILEAAVALVERERGDYDAEGEYSSFEASKLTPLVGRPPAIGTLALSSGEVLQGSEYWEGMQPDKSRRENTGNEGVYHILWYRRAGILVWPRSQSVESDIPGAALRLHLLLNPEPPAPPAPQLPAWLGCSDTAARLEGVAGAGAASQAPEDSPQQLATAIIGALEVERPSNYSSFKSLTPGEVAAVAALVLAACQLGDASLAERLLKVTGAASSTSDNAAAMLGHCLRACAHFGLPDCWRKLLPADSKNMPASVPWSVHLLECCIELDQRCPSLDGGVASGRMLTAVALSVAETVCTDCKQSWTGPLSWQRKLAPAMLALLRVRTAGGPLALNRAAAAVVDAQANSTRHVGVKVQKMFQDMTAGCTEMMNALGVGTGAGCPAYLKLLAHAFARAAHAVSELGPPPAAPQDWRKEAHLPCLAGDEPDAQLCNTCTALQAFLHDPELTELKMEEPEDPFAAGYNRTHLQRFIAILGLGLATDVKGNWREVGPLHKLTFTKSHKSYRMAAEEHAVLTQHRGTLAALWHDCLLHLLPMPVGAEAPGPAPAPAAPASPGKPPPCKKAALAAA
ncbi:type IIB DNA topoisomerase [Micractinium conductrix]|uniref:Type IIB DNA topoisomerase n=1 Tax=Micractinium conductrix TaxID=554055 RepID=A0A2P6V7V1_9CHLO|nr:type IIB DNA topoisomerase [Micractinium conductrix]|eukprot:PSC70164.1 type IIB DNA topoisomerase [Micractinium conductrix]